MSEISIKKAEIYLEAKEYIKALSVLKTILKDEPDKINAIRMSVKIYTELAKYEKAIKILQNVLELNPDYTWAIFSLGKLYKIIGEYDKAIKIYAALLKIYPKNPKISIKLAELYNKNEEFDTATEYLEIYFDYDNSDSIAWFESGRWYKEKNDLINFRDAFSNAMSIELSLIEKKMRAVELGIEKPTPKIRKSPLPNCFLCCVIFLAVIIGGFFIIPGGIFIPGLLIGFIPIPVIFLLCLFLWRWSVKAERERWEKWEKSKNEPKNLIPSYTLPKQNPEVLGAWQKLINFYLISKNHEEVIKLCEYATLALPLESSLYLTLGKAYNSINFYSKAIEIFKKGIEKDSENTTLINNLGRTYLKSKEYANAELTLESSLTIDSDNLMSLILYCQILYKSKKYEDSSIYFTKALNRIDLYIDKYLNRFPKVKFPLKGNIIHTSKDLITSESVSSRLSDFSKYISYKTQISYELGLAFLYLGEHDKVKELAKESLYVTENAGAYILLAIANFYGENYQKSIENCIKSLEINDRNKWLRPWLISAHFESGDTQKALEIANLILQDEPEDELIWNQLGYIYSKTGEYEKATEVLNKAIQINYKLGQPWSNLGYIEYKKGNYEQALEYIKKAIKKDPDYPRAYYYFAKVLYSQGKADEALVYCNECLKINPNFKDAYLLREKIKS